MAKLSVSLFFFLFLLISTMVPKEVEGQQLKRCQEELYKTGCTLSDCGKKCWDKHNDPGHKCIQNISQTDYACYCFFTCS